MEGVPHLPPPAASQKIPLIAVEIHCAFSLLRRVSAGSVRGPLQGFLPGRDRFSQKTSLT